MTKRNYNTVFSFPSYSKEYCNEAAYNIFGVKVDYNIPHYTQVYKPLSLRTPRQCAAPYRRPKSVSPLCICICQTISGFFLKKII